MMIIDEILSLKPWEETLKNEKLPVVLYGTGKGAEKISALFSRFGIKIDGVFVSDSFMRGGEFLGMKIQTLDGCESEFGDFVCVPAFGAAGDSADIIAYLAKSHRVVMPNLPVAGDGRCDKSLIEQSGETAEFVIDALADDESKQVMKNVLAFNITGDISYLLSSPSSGRYIEPLSGKRFIDVGAYNGDTALEYASLCPDYGDIIALEPSEQNYAKLVENTKNLRITCLNAAAWSKTRRGTSPLRGDGRGVSVGGGEDVPLYAVDDLCDGTMHAGVLKIDAEGAEREVLYGSARTVAETDCEVCCAVYHRADDIFFLLRLMLYYRPHGRIYLRKEKYLPAWDVFATLI